MLDRDEFAGDRDAAPADGETQAALLVLILAIPLVVLLAGGLLTMSQPDSSTRPWAKTIDIAILSNSMSPSEILVDESDQVTLQIRSVRPVAFDVHGYNTQREITAGRTTTLRFEALVAGRFVIDDERTGTPLGALIVRPHGEA